MSESRINLLILPALLLILSVFNLACPTGHPEHYLQLEIKNNLHSIQIAVERYAADNEGVYPSSIDDLGQGEYMPEFPNNPVTEEPMNEIGFGTEPFSGGYTYIPYTEDEKVIGYYLICYGLEDTEGADLDGDGTPDHVILVLEGYNEALGELPPIEELL